MRSRAARRVNEFGRGQSEQARPNMTGRRAALVAVNLHSVYMNDIATNFMT